MVLKAHFALLAFIVCTSYTSLHPSWLSGHTSQRPVRSFQRLLSVPTSQRSVCISHLSLSPYNIKYRCVLLTYWCTVLKTSTTQFLCIALRTSENSTAHFEFRRFINYSSRTIHENNIHILLIEIYKSLNHISPPIMQEFFDLKVTLIVFKIIIYWHYLKQILHDIRKHYVLKEV